VDGRELMNEDIIKVMFGSGIPSADPIKITIAMNDAQTHVANLRKTSEPLSN
jgi:hypothetical protein